MANPNLTRLPLSLLSTDRHLTTWYPGCRKVAARLGTEGIVLKPKHVLHIIQLFFIYAFQAQMRGWTLTWPIDVKRMELHFLKHVGPVKIIKHMAQQKIIFPDRYPGIEPILEPAGSRWVNYGYDFVPDIGMRRAVVKFLNDNPEIAEKIIP